jgi:hypothetical protein
MTRPRRRRHDAALTTFPFSSFFAGNRPETLRAGNRDAGSSPRAAGNAKTARAMNFSPEITENAAGNASRRPKTAHATTFAEIARRNGSAPTTEATEAPVNRFITDDAVPCPVSTGVPRFQARRHQERRPQTPVGFALRRVASDKPEPAAHREMTRPPTPSDALRRVPRHRLSRSGNPEMRSSAARLTLCAVWRGTLRSRSGNPEMRSNAARLTLRAVWRGTRCLRRI